CARLVESDFPSRAAVVDDDEVARSAALVAKIRQGSAMIARDKPPRGAAPVLGAREAAGEILRRFGRHVDRWPVRLRARRCGGYRDAQQGNNSDLSHGYPRNRVPQT